jgi:hypothetical protein
VLHQTSTVSSLFDLQQRAMKVKKKWLEVSHVNQIINYCSTRRLASHCITDHQTVNAIYSSHFPMQSSHCRAYETVRKYDDCLSRKNTSRLKPQLFSSASPVVIILQLVFHQPIAGCHSASCQYPRGVLGTQQKQDKVSRRSENH